MKQPRTMQKRIQTIKRELEKLYNEFKSHALLMECHLDNNDIPEGVSKIKFRKMVSEHKNLMNRNTIDRLFLEKMGILETPKRKSKNPKSKTNVLSNMGKLATKVRTSSGSLSDDERTILKNIIDDLQQDI